MLLVIGRNKTSKVWELKSLPDLQPLESINVTVPFRGEATVLDGELYLWSYSLTFQVDYVSSHARTPTVVLRQCFTEMV